MNETVYQIIFFGGMALIFGVLIAVLAYASGHEAGTRDQKEAEATARAARNAKPGDLTPCRDPQAVAEALHNLRSQDYTSPRNEIALALLVPLASKVETLVDTSITKQELVAACFTFADEFIKQADGRDVPHKHDFVPHEVCDAESRTMICRCNCGAEERRTGIPY